MMNTEAAVSTMLKGARSVAEGKGWELLSGWWRGVAREEVVMWLAASPLMFSATMVRVLRRNVRVEMELANTSEDDAVESMELGTVWPLVLATPGVNIFLFGTLAIIRRGYLIVNVIPAMCLSCFTSLLSRVALYFLSWSIADKPPVAFSPPLLYFLFRVSVAIDAVIFTLSVIPAYRHYKHQVYRRARHDIEMEREDSD
eukprot:TRINITY_DN12052_c0_g1_i1.p2 TRINITY_DN12052_c0_g1~~TRINITY_DN12052_c0_g1_i1.p2  ORF type:complete len:200 (+),score=31.87 TRINITY_DN12052_c0_g1_i1:1118-1717(+)